MMEQWRKVWRDGIVPNLSTPGLESLARALRSDDVRLCQGSTTEPPPFAAVHDWPVEKADAVAFALWQGDGLAAVGALEEAWARVALGAEQRLGEYAASRWWFNFWDETPRPELLPVVLEEVNRELHRRAVATTSPAQSREVRAG